MAASRWAIVCAGMLLAGGQLFPAWMQADRPGQAAAAQAPRTTTAFPPTCSRCSRRRRASCVSSHSATRSTDTLNGNYDGGGRAGARWPWRPGGGGGGGTDGRAGRGTDPGGDDRRRRLSLSPNRIARLKRYRHELAGGARQARRQQTVSGREDRPRDAQGDDPDATSPSSMPTRRRSRSSCRSCPSRRRSSSSNETRIRLEDVKSQQAAGMLTDLTREIAQDQGAGRSRVDWRDDRRRAEGQQGPRDARRGRGRRPAQQRDDLVQLLQRLRSRSSPGGWACRTSRSTRRSRTTPRSCATRSRRPTLITAPAPPAALDPGTVPPRSKINEVPDLQELIALPQDEMRDVVQRFIGASGGARRPRRDEQPRQRTAAAVLPRLAGGAEDARLRRAQPERAGRLPVHQECMRAPDRAARLRARGQSAAQDRRLRHPRRRPRPCRAHHRISPTR